MISSCSAGGIQWVEDLINLNLLVHKYVPYVFRALTVNLSVGSLKVPQVPGCCSQCIMPQYRPEMPRRKMERNLEHHLHVRPG